MPIPDKFVAITSSSWQACALPIVALLLSGCGRGHATAKPDAGKPDADNTGSGADTSPGPEAGPEVSVFPADPESCARATNVSECLFGIASATISSAAGEPLLAKIVVTNGPCSSADSCTLGCTSIVVDSSSANIGSTCDLEVTARDGRSQSVRLTIVKNPSPYYTCCGGLSMSATSSGLWVALNPTTFSPSSVVVDFAPPDAGAPIVDSGTDSGSTADTASPDVERILDKIDAGTDVLPVPDGMPDAYALPTDEQTCLKSTNVPQCGLSAASTTVSSATAGLLLAKVEVTAGSCSAGACAAGCAAIGVYGTANLYAGATCDLLVTAMDGRKQSLRLTVAANPSPSYMCCGYPLPPNSGLWTQTNPTVFSPSPVVVDFAGNGGRANHRRRHSRRKSGRIEPSRTGSRATKKAVVLVGIGHNPSI